MAERNEMEEMRVNMGAMQKSIEDIGNVIKTLILLIPENPSPRRAPLNNERTNQLNEEDWYEEEPQPVRQNVEIPAAAPRPPPNVEQPAADKYKTLQDQIEELKRTIIRSKESGSLQDIWALDEKEEQVGEMSWWAIKKELEEATKIFGIQNSEQVVNVSENWEDKVVAGEEEEDFWKPVGNEEVCEFGCGDDLWRSEDKSESFEVEEDLWAPETEVNHLTRSGRHYKPAHLVGEESSEAAVTKDAREEDLGDDEVLKQLKRTGANITLWQLIMASHKHRQAVLKALNKVPISIDTSPEQMVAMLTPPYRKTLNGQFVKEGEDVLFCGFDEPFYDEETGKRYPGFEVFFGHQLSDSEDEPNEVLILAKGNEDWIENLEQANLGLLFDQGFDPMSVNQDAAVMMLGAEDYVDYSNFIVDAALCKGGAVDHVEIIKNLAKGYFSVPSFIDA
ncbi:hypothetical protein Vadar_031317 [Vaccinium darrowii]|uniref:Uncharacterized protein n=1 Tax=Vaccinium darrowii TaxID=229202 RepID=A0ACB7XEJ7_9ERIC|nr:hypothetical protein Vadar_031317 [Vaccinium darrowii]